ncbi:ATP-dependent RNA helicase [Niveomyces insectorum RCEF 264]|uniref:ATP-dependent RNA helicase n=1 Tax=Niveomyces insectorum RCEF 264 TaxID=1081102 RepID=A0A167M5Q8_9HYPO|nr:ATP-dependent RNA helicase [Niveomyces insectorum RCEF 264]
MTDENEKKRKTAKIEKNPITPEALEKKEIERTMDTNLSVEEATSVREEKAAPTTFKELGLVDTLCEICTALGYAAPTPIQAQAIPVVLQNRDVIGTAETGSGKTMAFALPMLQALLEQPRPLFGLVLAPTRELAVQIGQTFEAFSALALRCAVVVGGMDMVAQTLALGKRPHVIVATPGRLLDHLEKTKGFALRQLRYLVIDEADRLLDMDFGPILEKILKHLPREQRRTLLFSATMSSQVESLQRASLRDPIRVSIASGDHQTVATLKQSMIFLPPARKDVCLVYLVNEFYGQFIVVFTRTIYEAQRLAILLRALGFGAIPLHGRLSQSSRLSALNKIKAGSRDILIATDVAARGLDIPRIGIVVNYDVPQDSKTYVHRVGRTARAGKSGHAMTLVTQYDHNHFLAIEASIGMAGQIQPYPVEKEELMAFKPRVEEAQRHAHVEMRAFLETAGKRKKSQGRSAGGGGSSHRQDDMDREEL